MSILRSIMGQFLDRNTEPRVPYDDCSDNGLILGDNYLPEELIAEILCYVDYKSLLSSQLVCKRWKSLVRSYVWRKKAEMACGRSLKMVKDVPWKVYYDICKKKPFDRNLLKNNCGQNGLQKHWKILSQGGDHWRVECPPVGVPPLPSDDPIFEGKKCCFATSYYTCSKQQTINLISEGLTSHLLDKFQPPIVISEWYSCRWDCPATYECSVKLIGGDNKILDTFEFRISIENDLQNQWHRVSHEFTNYGPGLEKITFYHGGTDNLFWAGHYGSKMAGASVIVKLRDTNNSKDEKASGGSVVKLESSHSEPRGPEGLSESSDDDESPSKNIANSAKRREEQEEEEEVEQDDEVEEEEEVEEAQGPSKKSSTLNGMLELD